MDLGALIQEALGGNMQAFDELYACSCQSVWFTCIHLLKNEQDAKDLMQDTYLTAFSKLNTLENPDAFVGWINRIAINNCKNYLRKNSAYTYDEMQDYADIPEVNEEFLPEEYVTNESKRKILLDIMQKSLSDVQYQTIILHYFDELSVAEIAELMECGEEAVKSRLRYARAKIKEEVLRYEKKNNDRLFVFVPILYLSEIFWSEANSSATPLINYAAQNLVQNSIMMQGGSKAMLKAGKAKLIAGIAAGAIVVGGAIALVKFSGKDNDGGKTEVTTNEQTTNEQTTLEQATEITTTQEAQEEVTQDGYCGLHEDYKDSFTSIYGDIVYGPRDISQAVITLDGIDTNVDGLLNACIEDTALVKYDSWLDAYISDRSEIPTVVVTPGEEIIRFYKNDDDFFATVTFYFYNGSEKDIPLSECTLTRVEIENGLNVTLDGTVSFGSSIQDAIKEYGSCYETASFMGEWFWESDDSAYKLTLKTENEEGTNIQGIIWDRR